MTNINKFHHRKTIRLKGYENELNAIRQYIIDNPKNWAKDENNPNLI